MSDANVSWRIDSPIDGEIMTKLNKLLIAAPLLIGLSLTGYSMLKTDVSQTDVLQANVSDVNESSMTVYKSPTCGCCSKWVDHINDNDIRTKVVELEDLSSIKTKYGIQGRYRSCHTGVVTAAVGNYIFEGHVPAEYVKAFLSNPPEGSIGLSVPGMPLGSPGMEVGDQKSYYQVLLLNKDGSSSIFAHVNQVN